MLTVIIGAVVGILVGLLLSWSDKKMTDSEDYLMASVIGLFLGGALSFFVALMIPPITEEKIISSHEIVSLQDNGNISGSFFLGCGSVNGRMNYIYYYEISPGSYAMNMLDYSDVTILFTEGMPKIEKIQDVKVKHHKKNKFAIQGYKGERPDRYKIYTPKGTILSNFKLDAQ